MKLEKKRRMRNFEFVNSLQWSNCQQWANEVIDSIEKKDLLVFDPKDSSALYTKRDTDGAMLLCSNAELPVKISEWLGVGCQRIRWFAPRTDNRPNGGKDTDRSCLAYYEHNAAKVLWPNSIDFEPQGPPAFWGEIIILDHENKWMTRYDTDAERVFKCIVAHELVHVFEMLRLLVPAFMNWRAFYENVLADGCNNDLADSLYHELSLFVDAYGEKNELRSMQVYWPSQADSWLAALREGKSW